MYNFRLKTIVITCIFGVICCSFLATILGYTSYESPYPSHTSYNKIITKTKEQKIVSEKETIQEVFYSKMQHINFSVIDFYANKRRNRYVKHGKEKGQVSWVTLVEGPGGYVVDKNDVKAAYYRISILAPFIVNENLKDYSSNMSVLLLGLGGGALTNYLSNLQNAPNLTTIEIDPTMKEISTKWFGLKESERNRVIIGDGIEFIEKTKQKYDSIILDACTPHFSLQIICPAPDFMKFNVISKLSTKLKPNGVFSANIGLTSLKDYKIILNKILKKYSKFFKLCLIFYASANFIIVCSNDSSLETVSNFNQRFRNLPMSFQKTLKTQFRFYDPEFV